jgi:endonuclease-3
MHSNAPWISDAGPANKRPFDIDVMVERLRVAVRPFRKAAMFELADDGYDSPFEQLVACIISTRTRDETTVPTARALFAVARTPEAMVRLTPVEIDTLIHACTFHAPKSWQIHELAQRVVEELGGEIPRDREVLMSFRGVGEKCANLVLGIAFSDERIGVDVHVDRIVNRWGYVSTRTPEQTLSALEAKLPRRYWIELNRLLVPFGKHVCTGVRPKCVSCPLLEFCRQVGVTQQR